MLFQKQNKQETKKGLKRTNPSQADNKFRNDPSYVEFKQQTSPLLLLPPPLYKAIPNLIQVTSGNFLNSSILFSASAAVSFPSTTSSVKKGEN